jgi:hypothetical protein
LQQALNLGAKEDARRFEALLILLSN